MPGTICTETSVAAACAVFKIDFKGRFVYIDDETEELLGCTREQLFGNSIYDFISNDSHQVLDTILGHHNRYESFYESLSLTIREGDGQFRQLEAVITLNFIAGNPVNYQFILIPSRSSETIQPVSWERRLLEMIQCRPDEIDFNEVAGMFCSIGGYSAGECYIDDPSRNLEIAGSYPHQDPGHSAPIYLERIRTSRDHRFSFIPEDKMLHEGFGNGKSEAVLSLRFDDNRNLLVWLYGPADFQPAETRLEDIRLFSQTWDTSFQPGNGTLSPSAQFSVMGQACDAMELGIVVVNGDFDIVYNNTCFSRTIGTPEEQTGLDNFREIYERLDVCNLQAQPIPVEQSPFGLSVRKRQFTVDSIKISGNTHPLTVLAGPVTVAETQLYVYCFIPYQDKTAEAYSMNRSGTKLILSVAHDLRAPLITIEAFARRLQSGHAGQLDDDGRFAVDCIVENGHILQDMIEGLGQLSQNWIVQEAPEQIYVRKIIEELVTYLRATYPNTDYHIKTPEGFPELTASKRKLVQLLRNILDNAFKYSASSKRPTVKIEYSLVDGWHQFSISDNGPGIDADYKQKIFSPFFRAPEASTLPGTGMGLTIASDIISSWGGKIWLETGHKSGTRISFTLPPRMKG